MHHQPAHSSHVEKDHLPQVSSQPWARIRTFRLFHAVMKTDQGLETELLAHPRFGCFSCCHLERQMDHSKIARGREKDLDALSFVATKASMDDLFAWGLFQV